MDDLDLLNTRKPLHNGIAETWFWSLVEDGFPLEENGGRIPADIFERLDGDQVTTRYRAYPTEEEAVLALYRAWEAARPGTFPLVRPCTCETCRGK